MEMKSKIYKTTLEELPVFAKEINTYIKKKREDLHKLRNI